MGPRVRRCRGCAVIIAVLVLGPAACKGWLVTGGPHDADQDSEDAGPDADSDDDSDVPPGPDGDLDADGDRPDADDDAEVPADSDQETDRDSDPDGDGDGDADGDIDADVEVDADPDPDPDEGPECPVGMVLIGSLGVCIDSYEASYGIDGDPVSSAGAMPWTAISWADAASACAAAGKRLCAESEWRLACEGASGTSYPYGDDYDPARCNGSGYGAGALIPTGAATGCEGSMAGLFDMSGNAAEWTESATPDLFPACGGAYSSMPSALTCTTCGSVHEGAALEPVGFRCCSTLP